MNIQNFNNYFCVGDIICFRSYKPFSLYFSKSEYLFMHILVANTGKLETHYFPKLRT